MGDQSQAEDLIPSAHKANSQEVKVDEENKEESQYEDEYYEEESEEEDDDSVTPSEMARQRFGGNDRTKVDEDL